MPADPWIVLAALMAEAVVSYPAALHRRLPHPVVWIGALLGRLERVWNRSETTAAKRKRLGVAALLLTAGAAGLVGWGAQSLPLPGPFPVAIVIAVGALGLAQRSLYDHVAAVARALSADDLPSARTAVGRIVGRDVQTLDADGIAMAGIESLAESFNDAVVAPVFWFLVGGLPGLFAYKAVNTADSMIGHMEPRWRAFGWAAARADDFMNFIPARIAGALIALAGAGGWGVMLRDAGKHASPNAGWPEASMAGALKVRLGGAAAYDGLIADRPALGEGATPTPRDLSRALRVYLIACGLIWAALAMGGLAWPR